MSIYTDREYLARISHKLDRFSRKSMDLWNFRCPFCLDSKKNKLKARGYMYRKGDALFYKCHNCGRGISFQHFLEFVDVQSYREYTLEKYAKKVNKNPLDVDMLKGNAFKKFAAQHTVSKNSKLMVPVAGLSKDHIAVQYLDKRCIPKEAYSRLYYTENFRDLIDEMHPDHNKELPEDERIVILFMSEDGESINYIIGRDLHGSKLRYISIKIVEDAPKYYGLERIDRSKTIYVVEGPLDSLFIDNCIACGDSNLRSAGTYLGKDKTVLIFDNQPRNKEVVNLVDKSIVDGFNVCIWSPDIEAKDINDMVCDGIDVMKMVQSRTYNGPMARLQFTNWKRI